MRKIIILMMTFILFEGSSFAYDEIRFVVPAFKPYTFKEEGKITGIGIFAIEEIMKELNVSYSLRLVPNYGRALLQVKNGKYDGFFLASQNAERNKVAVFSNPVTTNRWSWFLPADSTFNPQDPGWKPSIRVATHLNANTHKWLKKNGYQRINGVPNAEKLPIFLLELNRADTVFLAEMVFVSAAYQAGILANRYKQVVQIAKPFGIYIY